MNELCTFEILIQSRSLNVIVSFFQKKLQNNYLVFYLICTAT